MHILAPENAENATVVECGNGLGQTILHTVLGHAQSKRIE
jgi:hypothetical protein